MSAFVDTNVLVYAADETKPQTRKTGIARDLLLLPDLHLSVQVLGEFVASARNPKKLNFNPVQERDWLSHWLQFPVASLSEGSFIDALEIHHRCQLSHWDSMILASARECGCTVVYSEDLADGQVYGGVRVVDPFADLQSS